MLTTIQDAVKLLLPAKRKTNSSGWIGFNAPCCPHNGETPDTRGRGGLVTNPNGSVSYHCFNCNFKANYTPGRHLNYKFRKLLSWLGASENEVKRLVIDAIRVKDLVAPEDIQEEEKEEISFVPRPLPEGARSFEELAAWGELTYDHSDPNGVPNYPTELMQVVGYTAPRADIAKYKFYWSPDTEHNYHKRVIVPFYWKNQLIGSTARAIEDNIKPKYYNDYDGNYVFNTDRQTPEKKFVVVCEGPFDAMAIDGVAILSAECNETQADIIDSLGKEVILVPDFDITQRKSFGPKKWSGAKLIDQAIDYGWSVSFPVWAETCKDVSEAVEKYGKLFALKAIIEGKQSSRLKIELHKKKYYN